MHILAIVNSPICCAGWRRRAIIALLRFLLKVREAVMGKTLLLTGLPGCGKTTLIRKLIPRLPGPVGGFFTREIRPRSEPKGFEIVTLSGDQGVLAHIDIRGDKQVGRFGVDLSTIDRLAVKSICQAIEQGGYLILDEIGPMELLSSNFRQAVLQALDSRVRILGSILERRDPFADEIKSRPEVRLVAVTYENRDSLEEEIYSGLVYVRD